MLGYILKRLLLLIPTLLGVMTINFLLMQLSPGGPVEQSIAKMENLSQITEAPTVQIRFTKAYCGAKL